MRFAELKEALAGRTLFRGTEFGCSPRRYKTWCDRNLIVRLHRGIYRLAARPDYEPAELAGLVDPSSYLTGWSALDYHGLTRFQYLGPVLSCREGKSKKYIFEGRAYHYLKVCRTEHRDFHVYHDGRVRVATPVTAILDLCHRKGPIFDTRTKIDFERFSQMEISERLLSTRSTAHRRILGRLLALARQNCRRSNLRPHRKPGAA